MKLPNHPIECDYWTYQEANAIEAFGIECYERGKLEASSGFKVKDNYVAVSSSVFWLPVNDLTPRNTKVLAINRYKCGVAQFGEIRTNETWYDYWQSVPRFAE